MNSSFKHICKLNSKAVKITRSEMLIFFQRGICGSYVTKNKNNDLFLQYCPSDGKLDETIEQLYSDIPIGLRLLV